MLTCSLLRCVKQVDTAYDVVLMKSLKKRSQGEVSDKRVKYADVLSPGATMKQKLPPWARDLTSKLPPRPAFESPNRETLTQSGIALGVLAALVLAQGCTQVRRVSVSTAAFLLPPFRRRPYHHPDSLPITFCLLAFTPLSSTDASFVSSTNFAAAPRYGRPSRASAIARNVWICVVVAQEEPHTGCVFNFKSRQNPASPLLSCITCDIDKEHVRVS